MKLELVCSSCKSVFYREKGEVSRNLKLGRRVFCSRKCSGKAVYANIPEDKRRHAENLIANNRSDGYSMFRVFMQRIGIRIRDRGRECDLTLEDLKEQWEKQEGICPYTGWKLKTPKNTKVSRTKSPDIASLDRIDSTKGYLKGNIEFISLIAQYSKNNFEKNQVLDFCKAVTNNWKGGLA